MFQAERGDASLDLVLGDLTDAQRRAAEIVDGAVLVVAGPGSGKTRVITRRIANLLRLGIPPWQILALTFTNKAAGEMRTRVDALVPSTLAGRRSLTIATFHSFGAWLLRARGTLVGLDEGFSIWDTGDQRDAMRRAMEDVGLSTTSMTPASVLGEVSAAKNRLIGPDEFAESASDYWSRAVAKAYRAYQGVLAESNAVDFDDLLVRSATLLRGNDQIRDDLQQRFRYVLVDEYQDTNHVQFVIARLLAAEHGNLFVVGDPDQSIYGWRGADISNILEFETHFPGAAVIPLGENFRSTAHIVAASAGLIEHNRARRHKELSTALPAGHRPRVLRCRDEHEEADRVADFLSDAADDGVSWRSMAVLYRVNSLSRVVEDELRARRIPYVVARGTAFYDRKEVKDVLGYLRAVANPSDAVALRRIINVPARGIGATALRRLESLAAQRGTTLAGIVMAPDAAAATALGRSAAAVVRFGKLFASWRQRVSEGAAFELSNFVAEVLRESGLDNVDPTTATEEELDAKLNRDELVTAAGEWRMPEDADRPDPTLLEALRAFLESIALVSDQDLVDAERGAVTLMTLHAAKGLEFDTVAIVGFEQGTLPHSRAETERDGIEEERRLCFVGMTRAERRLLLTSAATRATRGARMGTIESVFLRELPAAHVERESLLESVDYSGIVYDEPDAFDGGTAGRFPVGSTVRHPQFGVGRVEATTERGALSSVRVAFRAVGIKTLVLAYARLERVDG